MKQRVSRQSGEWDVNQNEVVTSAAMQQQQIDGHVMLLFKRSNFGVVAKEMVNFAQ